MTDRLNNLALKGRNNEPPMPQSLVRNLLHLVYSTKNRSPWIPTDVQPKLFAYQAGIFKEWDSPAIIISGVEDHVHALFALSKNHPLIKIVEEVKKGSSKRMKTATGNLDFHWQNGYAAFSVSRSNEPAVHQYIQNQEEHHRKRSYEDELRALLRLNHVPFDERYVWD